MLPAVLTSVQTLSKRDFIVKYPRICQTSCHFHDKCILTTGQWLEIDLRNQEVITKQLQMGIVICSIQPSKSPIAKLDWHRLLYSSKRITTWFACPINLKAFTQISAKSDFLEWPISWDIKHKLFCLNEQSITVKSCMQPTAQRSMLITQMIFNTCNFFKAFGWPLSLLVFIPKLQTSISSLLCNNKFQTASIFKTILYFIQVCKIMSIVTIYKEQSFPHITISSSKGEITYITLITMSV